MPDKYYHDYPTKKCGRGNPYHQCVYCERTDPEINGRLEGHSADCTYRQWKERNPDEDFPACGPLTYIMVMDDKDPDYALYFDEEGGWTARDRWEVVSKSKTWDSEGDLRKAWLEISSRTPFTEHIWFEVYNKDGEFLKQEDLQPEQSVKTTED